MHRRRIRFARDAAATHCWVLDLTRGRPSVDSMRSAQVYSREKVKTCTRLAPAQKMRSKKGNVESMLSRKMTITTDRDALVSAQHYNLHVVCKKSTKETARATPSRTFASGRRVLYRRIWGLARARVREEAVNGCAELGRTMLIR